MKNIYRPVILASLIMVISCKKSQTQPEPGYAITPIAVKLEGAAREVSGIADSKANPGFLWAQEDSGNPAQLHLIGRDGILAKTIAITGADNRDWEDMALSSGPLSGRNYLYIADIGDNNAQYEAGIIYRFEEPLMNADHVSTCDKIVFRYPDGARDAEALLVDPSTLSIYIITKKEAQSKLYKLTYPQSITDTNTAVYLFDLPYKGVVSAAMSADNKEIIIKTYTTLYYYRRTSETIEVTLMNAPEKLGYQVEPQGEAVTFAADGSGFFTLSEETMGIPVNLNFYRKK